MQVTIGGNRVGSGKKMQAHINNYYRSTHNLSGAFASTMQCGILYPTLVKPVMRGDTFDIKIDQDTRTIPTQTALFGTFKMQTDVYFCPWRLYQGILHNNPLAIGLKMNQVKAPKLIVQTTNLGARDTYAGAFAENCLLKYLGMSGLGRPSGSGQAIGRKILAIPALAYYDIFKNYYANKQEENAYVITANTEEGITANIRSITVIRANAQGQYTDVTKYEPNDLISLTDDTFSISIEGTDLSLTNIQVTINEDEAHATTLENVIASQASYIQIVKNNEYQINVVFKLDPTSAAIYTLIFSAIESSVTRENILKPFNLKNIDDMRYFLLTNNELGGEVTIKAAQRDANSWGIDSGTDQTGLPYITLVKRDIAGYTMNKCNLNGLVLKTYQNDIFNNWLNTDWIEGENGINELTAVQVADGKFSMDALNFAQKLYNMLNRVAISGGTYEDWQDVVYEEVKRRQIESPIYLGGCSHEVIFDEIIQTTPTEGAPLGTLGGRGRLVEQSRKGGKIHAKIEEAGFIIAITSLTPRIYQSQGNEFYMTDIDTLDDLHKPGMDGIGFQDLIGERMAWWDTIIGVGGLNPIYRSKVGKLPAWIEYMTNYDKAYGDFAKEYGKGFGMILLRNYERTNNGDVKDFTTYIDPTKFNYAFANNSLDAQNFWVKIYFDIKARRLMSARLIPHV